MSANTNRKREKCLNTYLSGYKLMWAIVIFDLPVVKKDERKEATRFRKDLLDRGFQMAQWSVYFKLLSGAEELESLEKDIERILPKKGKVEIIHITDKQYEDITSFYSKTKEPKKNAYVQLQLF
jgi:CRISPR-associated protein Cas2